MTLSETFAKILRWGIFVSLFIPLVIFSQYLSPFHFGKMIVFRILVEIMAVFYIPLIIADKRYRPKWTLILISFSVFTALYVFTGLIGVNFQSSLWGSLERMGGIFSFIHFWIYFVILIAIIKDKKDWHNILKISVFVGFLSILFAYGQRLQLGKFFVGWQHGERVIGTIGNPALFAGYLLFILFLAMLFILRKDIASWQKGFFAAVIIFGIPVLLITAVRGAVIAFFASLFLLALFLLFKSENKKYKKFLLVSIIIFVLLVVMIWLNRNQDWVKKNSVLSRLSDISVSTSTIQTRLWSWRSGLEGWKDRPIFGWGPENFTFLHMKYFDSRHFTHIGAETIWDRAHNVLLENLSTMGIVGLLSYLSIFFFIFYFLIKRFKEKNIDNATFGVISALIIAYFVQNLFIFDTTANYLLFFLVLAYINFLSSQNTREDNQISKEPSIFLTAILLIISLVLIFQFNIKPAKANYACTRAILAGRGGDANKAIGYYQKASNYNTFQGAYEIRHKLATFVIQVIEHQRASGKEIDQNLLNLINYTIKEVNKNVQEYSQDTNPYLYLGRIYILLIEKDPKAGELAENSIQRAININEKNPRIWYELGQAQLSQKKYQDAYNSFKKALELNPNVTISHWFMASVAYHVGNYQEAVSYLDKALSMGYSEYKDSISDLARMINIYDKVGDYKKIVEMYKLAINLQPQNAGFHTSLAKAYALTGNYSEAKQEALKAVELDSTLKEAAEKFINSLPH